MVSQTVFTTNLSEAQVVALLSSAAVCARLAPHGTFGHSPRARRLSGRGEVYQVTGSGGEFVVRFPKDEAGLALLVKEERVQRGLRDRVTLRIPDTRVVDDLDGVPAFALHRLVPGSPLDTACYEGLSPEGRERLVHDLANFFCETHSVPLELACRWLEVPYAGDETAAKLAARERDHAWFGPDAVAAIRPALEPLLDEAEARLLEQTDRLFQAREVRPGELVFCHGDMHGYNVAMGEDELGAKLVGVFDLGNTGILDAHEDLFRLSLVSEDLVERVMAAYAANSARALDRDRIVTFYRAFLFHLMVGKSGERLAHLKRMLREHVAYYGAL
jgi:aminoglycoside phosphotransferase (APT) family kinase protein